MPTRCVVFGCSNEVSNGVAMHMFPASGKKRKAWNNFVKRTRKHWDVPRTLTHICSVHFADNSFINKRQYDMGLSKCLRLKSDAVPCIYPEGSCQTLAKGGLGETIPTMTTAMRKRMVNQLISAASAASTSEPVVTPPADLPEPKLEPEPLTKDASTQYDPPQVEKRRSIGIQVKTDFMPIIETHSRGNQFCPSVRDKNVSCDLKPKKKGFMTLTPIKRKREEPRKKGFTTSTTGKRKIVEPRKKCFTASTPIKRQRVANNSEEEDDEENDPTFNLSFGEDPVHTHGIRDNPHVPHHEEDKFLVFKSCLWQLFDTCPVCKSPCLVEVQSIRGSMVVINQQCPRCEYSRVWHSQPLIGNIPAGNLLLSGAILFSGASYTKTLRVLNNMNLVTITQRTFNKHAKLYLNPTIWHSWTLQQDALFDTLKKKQGGVLLGGDGRADSPGHNAKYISYTMMDLELNKVVDLQLIQSNEVGGSAYMEKEGLIRSVQYFRESGIAIDTLVTDRHPAVQKWVRENMPDTKHFYDVWHVAKGFNKKVDGLGKQKGCEEVREWKQSLSNHMYWCAASSHDEPGEVIVAKWQSVANHIQNVHKGHGSLFSECQHPDLEEGRIKKKWLKPSTKPCEKLVDIINNTWLLKAVNKLSTHHQTSNLESFHSLMCQFAPKMGAYPFQGMLVRLLMAILHYNENGNRPQAHNKSGEPIFALDFPKNRKGEATVKPKLVLPTYDYVSQLLKSLCEKVVLNPVEYQTSWNEVVVPEFLASQHHRPNKDEAVAARTSRFSK